MTTPGCTVFCTHTRSVGRCTHPVGAPCTHCTTHTVHAPPPVTHTQCAHPCAHVKTTPCTRAPVRAVKFQPDRPIATVCAFSRATQIVSGQPGRLPEPRRRSVAPGFAHSWLAGCSCAPAVHTPPCTRHGCAQPWCDTPLCARENRTVHTRASASRRVSAGATNCNCVRV